MRHDITQRWPPLSCSIHRSVLSCQIKGTNLFTRIIHSENKIKYAKTGTRQCYVGFFFETSISQQTVAMSQINSNTSEACCGQMHESQSRVISGLNDYIEKVENNARIFVRMSSKMRYVL